MQHLTRRIGLQDHDTVCRHEDNVFFVGRADDQSISVYMIAPNGQITQISKPQQDKTLLNSAGSPFAAAIWHVEGHTFYILSSVNLVLDLNEGAWTTFSNYYYTGAAFSHTSLLSGKGNRITAGYTTNVGNFSYLQVVSTVGTGKMGVTTGYSSIAYCLQAGTYSDGSDAIEYLVQTDEMIFGTPKRKFEKSRAVNCRHQACTLYLSHSDDGAPHGLLSVQSP
jgi:hypothetical protein